MAKSTKKNSRFKAAFVLGAWHSGASLLADLLSKYFTMNPAGLSQIAFQFRPAVHLNGNLSDYQIPAERLINNIIQNLRLEPFKEPWKLPPNNKELLKRLQTKDIEGVLETILESAITLRRIPEYWIDTVHRYSYAEVLKDIFPSARFIQVIRDGRDIALANFRFPDNVKNWALSALKWKQGVSASLQFAQSLAPEQFIEIRYEDLLSAPHIVMERLRNFLEIEDTGGFLRQQIEQGIRDDLPLDYPAMWKRRLSWQDKMTFEKVAAEELARYGYETFTWPAQSPHFIESDPWVSVPADYPKEIAELLVG